MDAIINLPEFIWEFISRQDFIGAYLCLVALLLLWLAIRGVVARQTRGFGSGSAGVLGQDAVQAGLVWLLAGGTLLVCGGYLWRTA